MRDHNRKHKTAWFVALLMGAMIFLCAFAVYAAEEYSADDDVSLEGYSEDFMEEYTDEYDMEEDSLINGFIPDDKEVYFVPETGRKRRGAAVFEEYYRSDEMPWGQSVSVMNQGKSNLCWAFSLTTAAWYSYAKEYYETTGEALAIPELSAGHLAQFFYHRVTDPLDNTEGDGNLLPAGNSWTGYGGNQLYTMQHMATWSGLGLEENTPFGIILESGNWEKDDLLYDSSYAYDDYITQQESICYVYETASSDRETLKSTLKEMIRQYGAVSISMGYSSTYFNLNETKEDGKTKYRSGRSFYNNTGSCSKNHAVVIIGWDDSYPKENFKQTPENDGAWIIQNSWGSDSHENGFFYMSYESAEVGSVNSKYYSFDMQPADTYQYSFQYDGSAGSYDSYNTPYHTWEGIRAANVFKNTTGYPFNLEAVGFTTYNAGWTDYKVEIYTGLKDESNPVSGTLAGTFSVSSTTVGCKSAILDQPVQVPKDAAFSVVFTFEGETRFGIEKERKTGDFRFNVETKPNQSFYGVTGSDSWIDLSRSNLCFRIKAFGNPDKDISGPEIDASTLQISSTQVQCGSEIALSLIVTDETDVDEVTVSCLHQDTQRAQSVSLFGNQENPDLWEGTLPITDDTDLGLWQIICITASDSLGNKSVLNNSVISPVDPMADLSAGDFTVVRSIENAKVELSQTTFTYNYKVQKPVIKAIGGQTLTEGTDYTAVWSSTSSKNAGTYTVTINGMGCYAGTAKASYRIKKASNPVSVTPKTANVSYSKLKKAAQTIKRSKALSVSGAKGDLTYTLVSVNKTAYSKYFKVYSKSGNIRIKKKLPKGTYKLKIKVTAAGNANFNQKSRTVTVKITVR